MGNKRLTVYASFSDAKAWKAKGKYLTPSERRKRHSIVCKAKRRKTEVLDLGWFKILE